MIHAHIEYRATGNGEREITKIRFELDDKLRPLVIKILDALLARLMT